MLDFDEELARFKPAKDISKVEDTIITRDITDIKDVMAAFLESTRKDTDGE